jgi:hypothetical protein
MLVTFTTDAYADMTMFGDVAIALLKMMGHSGSVPGALRAEDVPAALSRLTAALEAEKAQAPVKKTHQNDDNEEPTVSLTTRAIPFIALLTAAANAGANVMWN